jgi:hypothetical protein
MLSTTLADRLINAPAEYYMGCTFTLLMVLNFWHQYRWMRKQRIESDRRIAAKLGKII